jgi:hypothetical protein
MDRRKVKRFLVELRPLLQAWDPIGLFDADSEGPPEDEYDCMAGHVVKCLLQIGSEDEAVHFMQAEARGHMGIEVDDASTRCLLRSARALWDRLGVSG